MKTDLTEKDEGTSVRRVNENILNTIEVLAGKVALKEEEANKLKKLVNELCAEIGEPLRYAHIAESGAGISSIRSDQFYGQPITAAIRDYLKLRESAKLGAASINEIYAAIKEGGFKWDTKNEMNAKIGVSNTLRKSSSIFHKLPNGRYGLLAWYPSAKSNGESAQAKKAEKAEKPANGAGIKAYPPKDKANQVTQKDIREVVLATTGEFEGNQIEKAVREKFPGKEIYKTKVPSVIFNLKEAGLIRLVSPKIGSKPAVYVKA